MSSYPPMCLKKISLNTSVLFNRIYYMIILLTHSFQYESIINKVKT